MNQQLNQKLAELRTYLAQFPELSIAVSGGVDSMLLMYIAAAQNNRAVYAIHAFSAAVPSQAHSLVKEYAKQFNWQLKCIDVAELEDQNYRKNPANRCYFCKSNLYKGIAAASNGIIASGTNTDDLSDYRPGLVAAKENNVIHPYVACDISKSDIYALAALLGLEKLKDLPAQPCLASRVETGIEITRADLQFIDKVETMLRPYFIGNGKNSTLRCRVTHAGVYVEADSLPQGDTLKAILTSVQNACTEAGHIFSGVRQYKKGSAFII